MRVLVGCEFSGRVRDAFRSRGHQAWSCDIEECDGDDSYHLQMDLFEAARLGYWDLLIAFPPCTYLCASGARWWSSRQQEQSDAVDFFLRIAHLSIPRIAIENPIGLMSRVFRKPDQIIQPWMFGHGETKSTCLWLKGLPLLVPTEIVDGREQKIWKMSKSANRSKMRSLTYTGIAEAMASQWG